MPDTCAAGAYSSRLLGGATACLVDLAVLDLVRPRIAGCAQAPSTRSGKGTPDERLGRFSLRRPRPVLLPASPRNARATGTRSGRPTSAPVLAIAPLADLAGSRRRLERTDETYLPTETAPAQESARFPHAHVLAKRPAGAQGPAAQGTQAPDGLAPPREQSPAHRPGAPRHAGGAADWWERGWRWPERLDRFTAIRWRCAGDPARWSSMERQHRLRSAEQFARARREGRTWSSQLVLVNAVPNSLDQVRCGFSVSRRVGPAVRRNLVRRRLREVVRRLLPTLRGGWDLVFVSRPGAAEAPYGNLERDVREVLRRARLLREAPGVTNVAGKPESKLEGR
jgi:ribonuclease P protein component